MSKFDETLSKLQEDLQPLEIPNDQYLATCVQSRINQNLEKYNRKFNKLLDILEKESLYEKDLTSLLKSVEALSSLVDHTYTSLLHSIQSHKLIVSKLKED